MWYLLLGLMRHSRSAYRPAFLFPGVMIFTLLVLGGCHRRASESLSPEWIETRLRVINEASTSGCGYLLRPEAGPDLVPVSFAGDPVDWVQEGVYQVTYRPEPVPVYACTAEGIPVQVGQVEAIDTKAPPGTGGIRPEIPTCVLAIDPYQVPWMARIMEQADPKRVVRYTLDRQTVYGFWGSNEDEDLPFYLFDCRGNRLCVRADDRSSCTLEERLQDAYTILTRNH